MKITQPGKYRLLAPVTTRGPREIATFGVGSTLEITQVDRERCRVIGPKLFDWIYDEQPVELVPGGVQ